ncbi:MAG: electron transfer flavoprotein subunit beta/FixA family protein [Candidatus Aminicenantes bacterium]|nr:electron transfer flavoprotein subunit beta/FixA family protein [Candidatus Aminicenantes bacterium]
MNIFVFIKRVPDTESRIRIRDDGRAVAEDGLNFILSPYDEYAVEEALRLKEAKGGTVTAVALGPETALVVLRKSLAMGADEAVLIKDEAAESYDGLRTATILAAYLKAKAGSFDLLLFGKQAVGSDNAQVPSMVAGLLGLPQVNVVTKLEIGDGAGTALREIEGSREKVVFSLPAVVSAQKGLNEPRYETLRGIMAAKKKAIPVLTPAELGLSAEDTASRVEVVRIEIPPARKAGTLVTEPAAEAARRIVAFLRNDAKVI